MELDLVQIDAFADRLFEGNPAAVVPLAEWLDDEVMQAIAAENNLSETAFTVPRPAAEWRRGGVPAYGLRWFTPTIEVDLCGHATLAAGAYLLDDVHPTAAAVSFSTRSGALGVERAGPGAMSIDLPAELPVPVVVDPRVVAALGVEPVEVLRATDLICVLATAAEVRGVQPDLPALAGLDVRGVMVTAPGDDGFDIVSRWFGPAAGVPEDPVTGSAHSQVIPYWAARLGRTELLARQASARGGTLACRLDGDRVVLTGRYQRFLAGRITLH